MPPTGHICIYIPGLAAITPAITHSNYLFSTFTYNKQDITNVIVSRARNTWIRARF